MSIKPPLNRARIRRTVFQSVIEAGGSHEFAGQVLSRFDTLMVAESSPFATKTCSLKDCGRSISRWNRSGVCTHCWIHRPEETAVVWKEAQERTRMLAQSASIITEPTRTLR